MESLLTTEDVSEYFRMDVVTVRRMISKGELPAYRVGGEYRFKQSDIDEYLERQRVPARTDARASLTKLTRQARKLVASGPVTTVFERFTKRAQRVLTLAQEEAQRLNHNYLGTEHVLLGVLREGEGLGARLVEEFGCTLDTMRQSVQDTVGKGPSGEAAEGEVPVTPRLKKVLELAVDEAARLEHRYVGTEHLVLGLLREGEGVAGRLLKDLGMELSTARARVQELMTRQEGS